jgi:O-antigen/teichoic acid export membrane protein
MMPHQEITGAAMLPTTHLKAEPEPPASLAHILTYRQRTQELAWVIAGKLVMMGANAALLLLLAEHLELKLYGLLVTSICGQLLLSRVLLLGIERGVIRLHTLPELRHQERELFNAGWVVISRMSALLILIALVAVWAREFSDAPHWPGWMIASVVGGAIGTAIVDYGYSIYLSHVQYRAAALSQGVTALGRLAVIALVVLIWPHYPLLVFLLYPGASLVSGLTQAMLILHPKNGGESRPDRALVRRLLRFSLWQGGTNFAALLNLYQGTFLLAWLGQEAAAGIFGLGLTLSMGFSAVCISFTEFLAPRVARVQSLRALPPFIARAFGGALVLALGSVPVALAISLLITEVLPPGLHEVVPIFYCLTAAIMLPLFQSPLEAACYYLLRPQLMTLGMILRVICVGSLALLLVPGRGAWGAAVAQLCGTVMALMGFTMCGVVALRTAQKAETRVDHL